MRLRKEKMSKIDLKLSDIINDKSIYAFNHLVETIQCCGNDCLVLDVEPKFLDSPLLSVINYIHTNNGQDKNKSFLVRGKF